MAHTEAVTLPITSRLPKGITVRRPALANPEKFYLNPWWLTGNEGGNILGVFVGVFVDVFVDVAMLGACWAVAVILRFGAD